MVAIKDAEIPSSCIYCDIRNGSYCYAKNKPPYNIKGNLLTRDDDCPLVEIEERKVGKWIFTKTIFDKFGSTVECQSCRKKWKTYDEIRWKKENKFCPNCGAEMRDTDNG